ncbi:MAG: thermonuclease family protein [Thermodesulfovibrionales bacterium]
MKSLLQRIIFRMIKKHLNVVLLIFCIFLLYGSTGVSASHHAKDADAVRSEKIYDGDTIGAVVDGRFVKIRLLGIDAPEMDQRPWGKKSRECLRSLISAADSKVSLEYDIDRRDKYGRILAYVWTQDGKMLNEEMMEKGCAVLFTFPPNVKYAARLRAAQKKAQEHKAGLWCERGLQESPYDYRKKHPRK